MSLTSLSSSDVRKVAKLIEKREALQSAVDDINKEIEALASGSSSAPKAKKTAAKKPVAADKGAAKKATAPKAGSRRGKVKAAIVKQLKAAGSKGVSVKEISAKLKTKPANIHAWFHSTGKKMKEVEKLEGANYRWNG